MRVMVCVCMLLFFAYIPGQSRSLASTQPAKEGFGCGEDEGIFEGRCVNLHESELCPEGERLYRVQRTETSEDEVECNCEEGFKRQKNGRCYQVFSRGTCLSDNHILMPVVRTPNITDPSCRAQPMGPGGRAMNAQACIFPFKYKNIWYTGCTSAGMQNGRRWCGTTPYPSGGPQEGPSGDWGYCSNTCKAVHDQVQGSLLLPNQLEMLEQVIKPKLECQINPCGDPSISRPHSSTWTGQLNNVTCHPLAEDVSDCEMELRNVGEGAVGQLVCYSPAETVNLSILSQRETCRRGRVWSRWRLKCVRVYFVS